jgi:imidazolonepropionase-like amidohydrolase
MVKIHEKIRVDAELLIPGRGEPIAKASLVVDGRKIIYVGKRSDLPQEYSLIRPTSVPILMPGMWDCHVHFFGATRYSIAAASKISPALAGARGVRDLVATLNAGFTSVREVGGYGAAIHPAVAEGWIPGPNIYSSVSLISPIGGHADGQELPLATLDQKMRETEDGLPFYICDGVTDCIKAVRILKRRGAKLIKVATSGGVASPDEPQMQEFSPEELTAIVKEAARWDMIVAAHCHGERGIYAALEAGCATIEHGSYLTDKAIDIMRDQGTILVATRSVLEFGARHPEAWDKDTYEKLVKVDEANRHSYKKAIKAGVKIALGTDIGVSTNITKFNHGMNGTEFEYAVESGMTPLQAIEAGCAMGPETLGKIQAEKVLSGQLKNGYEADFIALRESPLEDITLLGNPDAITHVWKAGKLYKSPGRPVNILD